LVVMPYIKINIGSKSSKFKCEKNKLLLCRCCCRLLFLGW
jgi:hypothetical protein